MFSWFDLFMDWPCQFCFQKEATCWCGSTYFKLQKKMRAAYREREQQMDTRTITFDVDLWQYLKGINI